jgi:pimeloyl-ACP methyl ester carboxylesterase
MAAVPPTERSTDWIAVVNIGDLRDTYYYSHLDANSGTKIKLFVREFDPQIPNAPVVIMLPGLSIPAVPVFALGDPSDAHWSKYNWALSLAAFYGCHVYIMDLQGLGFSTRPNVMDRIANVNHDDLFKIGRTAQGPYEYKRYLTDSDTELGEFDFVVRTVLGMSGAPAKVHLVGYSAGAQITGRYAMENSERVASLLLVSPGFPPWGYSSPQHEPPFGTTTAKHLAWLHWETQFGFPVKLQSRKETMDKWCADGTPRETGIEDQVWASIKSTDPDWSANPVGDNGGVFRYPNRLWWGWNKARVESDDDRSLGTRVPVAIVYGMKDTQALTTPEPIPPQDEHQGPPLDCRMLYEAIPGQNKLQVSIANAGHQLQWETQYNVLHNFSAQWIHEQRIQGQRRGKWHVDTNGQFVSAESVQPHPHPTGHP